MTASVQLGAGRAAAQTGWTSGRGDADSVWSVEQQPALVRCRRRWGVRDGTMMVAVVATVSFFLARGDLNPTERGSYVKTNKTSKLITQRLCGDGQLVRWMDYREEAHCIVCVMQSS
jgi:hypothetical protein